MPELLIKRRFGTAKDGQPRLYFDTPHQIYKTHQYSYIVAKIVFGLVAFDTDTLTESEILQFIGDSNMYDEIVTTNGKTYVRISKAQAKKEFNKGTELYVVPNHVRFGFDNQWVVPCVISNAVGQDFELVLREYMYYNCCHILGTYVKFFIEKKEEQNV